MALKRVGQFLSMTFIGLAILAGVYSTELKQLYMAVNLFKPDVIVHNFSNMKDIMPTKVIKHAGAVRAFQHSPQELPKTFVFKGKELKLDSFLSDTQTTALLVVKDEAITFENYYLNTLDTDLRASWSMAKSYLSAIFGIAVYEGHIKDLNVPVTDYVPALVGSGYDGVTIKNVLQMSSGVAFNEDYNDFNSDINRFGRMMAMGGSFDEFAASLINEREQGTYMKYVSIDTHVLGMVLRAATGKTIEEYLAEKLWSKLGNEQDARYLVDGLGEPMVLGGLNATTRDYGRLGMLFRDNGLINGEQVVSAQWIKDSITPDASHLMPGKRDNSSEVFGYGYQWWIPEQSDQEFFALGIYGQFIYINQKAGVVIVKNSANTHFTNNDYESIHQSLAAFRGIALSLMEQRTTGGHIRYGRDGSRAAARLQKSVSTTATPTL